MKQQARLHCDYSFPRLLEEVPALLGNYSISSIRRHVRRCLRFMDAYRRFSQEGMVGPLRSYAVKKFHFIEEFLGTSFTAEINKKNLVQNLGFKNLGKRFLMSPN